MAFVGQLLTFFTHLIPQNVFSQSYELLYCLSAYRGIILFEGGEIVALHIAKLPKISQTETTEEEAEIHMTNKLFALPVLMGALLIAGTTQAHAATDTEGSTTLNLDIDPVANIEGVTASFTLTPTAADYRENAVAETSAISFNVFSNNGYTVTATGNETGGLKSAHIGLKRNGAASYVTLVNSSAVELLSGPASSNAGEDITVDVEIELPDADGATAYEVGAIHSNEITFTVEAEAVEIP
jgi:hypothetical protein